MEFYKFMEEEFLRLIKESRTLKNVLGDLNTKFIALISKRNEIESPDDYKPISLCNSRYGILNKILENKLKGILSKEISKEQFSFLHK
jgi:hypothetical protein